ncbi:hypothetical protein [Formosa sediminum]|nr:hypothetical protein [Formosa sediminum]
MSAKIISILCSPVFSGVIVLPMTPPDVLCHYQFPVISEVKLLSSDSEQL